MRISAGKIERTQKCVIYGCEGIGKSTFASLFPNPLFADLESGTAHINASRIDGINTWEDLLNAVDELSKERGEFKSFILDTADWAERLCIAYLCRKYKKAGIEEFGYGKGWQYLAEEFAILLGKLTSLQNSGMHIVVLAHSMIRKLELPEETGTYDHYELKCSKTVSPLIKEWSDGLLFANYRTTIQTSADGKGKAIGGKERVLYTEHTAFCDAKNRWGLPATLPMKFESIASVFGIVAKLKTPIEQLATALELSDITVDELNDFLRGNNDKKSVLISAEQTYENLPNATIEKLVRDESWEKVETQIRARRAK